MGFYVRKSLSIGPLRFNLSNSGIGMSVGARGFRIGFTPRGHRVNMGGKGLFYRHTFAIGEDEPAPPPPPPRTFSMRPVAMAVVGLLLFLAFCFG